MEYTFFKYHGTGNDFILLDDRQLSFPEENTELIHKLCERHFGIGADGLMLLRKHPDFDFEMIYYNADGNKSTMCGNGGRCIAQFAFDLGIVNQKMSFVAVDGPHQAEILELGLVQLQMQDVTDFYQGKRHFEIDTGSPHFVRFTDLMDATDFVPEARGVRYRERYHKKGGINVNFATQSIDNCVEMRTYERGVEDETMSCGTGVVATALAASTQGCHSPVEVHTKGGKLNVYFEGNQVENFRNILLQGPVSFVFKGQLDTAQF